MIIDLRTYLGMLRRSLRQEQGDVPLHVYLLLLKRRENTYVVMKMVMREWKKVLCDGFERENG